ncbi:putative phage abortive infection protein [Crenothrix polyspora]|uniref:putative phage abortive infection protein n=1 Tax=Crenothrix polyspora TaxID=360316 RepID=UPI0015945DE3|nr:putative phage abortive infection protein [Crenothrix polyspora]
MVTLAFVFLTVIAVCYFKTSYGPSCVPPLLCRPHSYADFGVIGDFFGGILNPIFSFLGLVLLLATLRQNEKELALSRKELKKSNKALKEQAKTQKQQRFESTFFSLLDQHNKLLDVLTAASKGGSTVAGDLFLEIKCDAQPSKSKLLATETSFHQYARILYQILKFICIQNTNYSSQADDQLLDILKNSPYSNDEKLYSSMVRALLSNDIYLLLVINCYVTEETDDFYKFKKLIERYSFFEHLSTQRMTSGNLTSTSNHIKTG